MLVTVDARKFRTGAWDQTALPRVNAPERARRDDALPRATNLQVLSAMADIVCEVRGQKMTSDVRNRMDKERRVGG
tara:strand:- start:240 stop:467 length:228 start_codon:yes stop_codon:yes gene_type:complete